MTKKVTIKCSIKRLCGVEIPKKSCKNDFESFNTIYTGFTISYKQDLFWTNLIAAIEIAEFSKCTA